MEVMLVCSLILIFCANRLFNCVLKMFKHLIHQLDYIQPSCDFLVCDSVNF
ncbi:hypothetical protein M758_UG234000 [Ceratodon purpureus]|nr:hypothetical protein M758_UG234000 [Ceratodon purpureus]